MLFITVIVFIIGGALFAYFMGYGPSIIIVLLGCSIAAMILKGYFGF